MDMFFCVCKYVVIGLSFSILAMRAVQAMESSHHASHSGTVVDISVTNAGLYDVNNVVGNEVTSEFGSGLTGLCWTGTTTYLMLAIGYSMVSMLIGTTNIEVIGGGVSGILSSVALEAIAHCCPEAYIGPQRFVGKAIIWVATGGIYMEVCKLFGFPTPPGL